jgi:GNAT superfamily N-acetyltransferase
MIGVRPFRPGDEAALYEVCLRTGDAGNDATHLFDDPALLGEVFVGPYLRFAPDLAWVYADAADVARAYVLGATDTAAFENLLAERWWPELQERFPLAALPDNPHDRDIVEYLHAPPRRDRGLVVDYPAHLHIDLVPEVQGGGRGGAMLRTLLDALSAAGAPGVHLGVARSNERAIGFYTHLGFTAHELGSTTDELLMVRPL